VRASSAHDAYASPAIIVPALARTVMSSSAAERLVLVADHVLYGLVLSEFDRRLPAEAS
jgi:hypothetical protein